MVKTKTISPFGEIIKNINIRNYCEKMRFLIKKTNFSRYGGNLKPSTLQPVLPLVPESLPMKEQDKLKFISNPVLDSRRVLPPTRSLFASLKKELHYAEKCS
jgi:hypothetical protein